MLSFKSVLMIGYYFATVLIAFGFWTDPFKVQPGEPVKVSWEKFAVQDLPTTEWHVASEQVSCTSGVNHGSYTIIGSADPIPMSTDGDIAKGLSNLFDYDEKDSVFSPAPTCDDLGGHIDRVDAITKQIISLADWSDVSSQADERVAEAMKQVGVLNSEREGVYTHLDNCVTLDKITPDEHEFISTMWIVPAWRQLANASSRLDLAISFRSLSYK